MSRNDAFYNQGPDECNAQHDAAMPEPFEQNKKAKQWLKDRGFVVETVEQAFDFDRQAQQLESYASQQTASLQKQVEELREENERLKASQGKQNVAILNHLVDKGKFESRIAHLEEALKYVAKNIKRKDDLSEDVGLDVILNVVTKALNPQDNQKEKMSLKAQFEKSSLFDKDYTIERLRKNNAKLEAENLAANKRIEELTAKNLKLLNENNDLWDKVNNPKMKV